MSVKSCRHDATSNQDWMLEIQESVDRVVEEFYRLPPDQRSGIQILKSIGNHWPKNTALFKSSFHYVEVLMKSTDYLVQDLLRDRDSHQCLLLKDITWEKDMNMEFRPDGLVARWTPTSFVIKKYIITDYGYDWGGFQRMVVRMFDPMMEYTPDHIEFFDVLSGSQTVIPIQGVLTSKPRKRLLSPSAILTKKNTARCTGLISAQPERY